METSNGHNWTVMTKDSETNYENDFCRTHIHQVKIYISRLTCCSANILNKIFLPLYLVVLDAVVSHK